MTHKTHEIDSTAAGVSPPPPLSPGYFSTMQMAVMRADIIKLRRDYKAFDDGNQSQAQQDLIQADVGKFYQDQAADNVSAYPKIATRCRKIRAWMA